MKKTCFSLFIALISWQLIAQINPGAGKTMGNNSSVLNNPSVFASMNTFIEIYEQPNYQGRMVKVSSSQNPLVLPFVPDRISIKKGTANFRASVSEASGNRIAISGNITELRVNNGGLTRADFELPMFVEIYENPNFAGRVKRFEIYTDEIKRSEEIITPNLPFSSNLISIKLSEPNLVAYIYETQKSTPTLYGNTISSAPLNGTIRKIRIGRLQKINVAFHGILAEIHNNDCKRIRGWVKYNLQERDKDNRTSITEKFANLKTAFDERSTTFIPNNLYDINSFWVLLRDGVSERLINSRQYPSGKYSIQQTSSQQGNGGTGEFWVDEGALYTNRIFLTVYTKLNSAHKGCDLCNDYNEQTGMQRETETSYLLDPVAGVSRNMINGNSGSKLIQAGPYRVASVGPDHLTYLQFGWINFWTP